MAQIITCHGSQAALRYGVVRFDDGAKRRYQWDRLSQLARLFIHPKTALDLLVPDDDPHRTEEARIALMADPVASAAALP